MSIKLSVPEFVVALFGLNPNQCRLTITGRIANVHGLAYQVQSLLCDQLKFQSRSYRAGTVSLGGETLDNFNERPSLATARFSINTLIDELAKVQITHTGGVAALFGKDEAWSWRLPIMVFITAAIFFSTLIVWNLSKAPIYNPKEFFCFVVGVIFLSLLCCLFSRRFCVAFWIFRFPVVNLKRPMRCLYYGQKQFISSKLCLPKCKSWGLFP